ncbi:TRAP transporter fused permease subunit [Elioraea sp.]|uniref:TRAP transporter permease n=1 Tax=Elioraea sp. TaxID=2185103 RepID=UPI0025C52804|nr:TRAP transporter fused permease subunit [Elioraea sp.]
MRALILGYAALVALAHLWLGGASAIELLVRTLGMGNALRGVIGVPDPLEMRGFHLASLLPLVFLLYPARPGASPAHRPSALDWLLAVACTLPSLYILVHAQDINARMEFIDPLTDLQFWLGLVALVLLLEAIRRAVAPVLAIIVLIALVYMHVGQYMGGIFNTRPFDLHSIVETAYIVPIVGGIFGPLTGIVASTIAMFILFGAFIQGSGTGRLFSTFGAAVAGRYAGGPAKVAVITSGLFGTMSGSTVSNVVTTGAITIPMMKRLGYRPAVAGGVEAAASTGGALMPPVMGAAAFVMSEITQIPYGDIIVAAAIGAVLYYFAIFVSVHFEAKRLGLSAMPEEEIPSWREVAADLHLVIPIGVLVWLLMERWSGNFAAFCAVIASVVAAALKARTRMNLRAVLDSLSSAACTMALLAAAVAGAGVITSALTVTGLVVAFGGIVKGLAGGSLALLCVLLMITALVLGMGVPTTPAYIITAALGSPILREYGVDLLPAHLFMFYFAVLADATPPVAVASYAAAAIAGANPLTTGLHALRFALAGFVVGYAFIYDQGVMLRGSLFTIVEDSLVLAGALTLIGAGFARHLRGKLTMPAAIGAVVVGGIVAFGHMLSTDARLLLVAGTLAVMALAPRLFSPRESLA